MDELTTLAIKDIGNAAKDNSLIIFVGAGVSKNSGLPSWGELIQSFKDELHLDEKENDYVKIAQYYYDSLGQHQYYQEVTKVFQPHVKARPNAIHDEIFRLKPKHIITTNYDRLLEDKMKTSTMKYEVIKKDADIPYAKSDHYLIKMHGDLIAKNIVLKEDDFLDYEDNFYMISTLIKSLIMNSTVLFVGYSLNDSTFNSIFRLIQKGFGGNARKAYFYSPKIQSTAALEYYKNKGIRIIMEKKTPPLDEIGEKTVEFLQQIKDEGPQLPQNAAELYDNLQFLNQLNYVDTQTVAAYTHLGKKAQLLAKNHYQWTTENHAFFSIKEHFLFRKFLEEKTSFETFLDYQEIPHLKLTRNQTLAEAFFAYENQEYLKAKQLFREIANDAFIKKDYWNYLVAEFNVDHIIIKNEEPSLAESSVRGKNLSQVVESLIINGDKETQQICLYFRDEILNFRFIYRKLLKFNESLDKIRIEKNRNAVIQENILIYLKDLQLEFRSLMKFVKANCLTIFQYKEFKMLVRRYFECLLVAYGTKDETGNPHHALEELSLEDLKGILPFLKRSHLFSLMSTYQLTGIRLSKVAEDYLFQVIGKEFLEMEKNQLKSYQQLDNAVSFLAVMETKDVQGFLKVLEDYPILLESSENLAIILKRLLQLTTQMKEKDWEKLGKIMTCQLNVILEKRLMEVFSNIFSFYQQLLQEITTHLPDFQLESIFLQERLLYLNFKKEKRGEIKDYQKFLEAFGPFLDEETQNLVAQIKK